MEEGTGGRSHDSVVYFSVETPPCLLQQNSNISGSIMRIKQYTLNIAKIIQFCNIEKYDGVEDCVLIR